MKRYMDASNIKLSGSKIVPNSDFRGRQYPQNAFKKENEKGKLRIGTWNVRSLLKEEKLENLRREMIKNRLDMIGVSETRWEGQGEENCDGAKLFYSGKKRGKNGVGLLVSKELSRCVTKEIYGCDRVIALKLKALPKDILVIEVYMPTIDQDDEEVDDV